jgi:galactokinase
MIPSFESLFGRAPAAHGAAPGRVNLMGDHTDYNHGFVLPAAIPQETTVQLAPRSDGRVRVWSEQFPATGVVEYDLGREQRGSDWADYVRGMTTVLSDCLAGRGFEAHIASTVPVGSGLSSSASLEIALGRALRSAMQFALSDEDLARAGQRAENEFVGAPVGIMDQMACCFARERSPMFLDTRSLTFESVMLPDAAGVLVVHSGVTHQHAGGGYAARHRECADAAAALGVQALREVSEADLPSVLRSLPEPLGRRVRHVVTENARVRRTVAAFRAGDMTGAGELFRQSHASLRDDFEVSVREVDVLAEIAQHVSGAYGARLTGGGFGGSVVALCARDAVAAAAVVVSAEYHRRTGRDATVVVPPAQG